MQNGKGNQTHPQVKKQIAATAQNRKRQCMVGK
jgi:hypothetical protein